MKRSLCIGLLLCVSSFLYRATAQTVPGQETISVSFPDVNMGTQALPFDVPFDIVGTVPDDYISISARYRLSDASVRQRGWVVFPRFDETDKSDAKNPGWFNLTVFKKTGSSIRIHCPGLHPNRKYQFEFTVLKKVPGDDASKKVLKDKIGNQLVSFFKSKKNQKITNNDVKLEEQKVDLLLTQHLKVKGSDILDKTSNTVYQTDFSKTLNDPNAEIIEAQNNLLSAEDVLRQSAIADVIQQMKTSRSSVISQINSILAIDTKNSPDLQIRLSQIFNPALLEFNAYTVRDGLLILRTLAEDPDGLLKSFLDGTVKISNKQFANSTSRDLQGIAFVSSFIHFLNEGNLDYVQDNKRFQPFMRSKSNTGIIVALKNAFTLVNDKLIAIAINKALLTETLDKLPDLTADLVISESLIIEVIALPDVESNKTPYISLEAGVGYTPSFRTAFSYYGANFYLTPVNKKANFRTLRGWDAFKKIFSFQIGIAQSYNDRPENTKSLLGSDTNADLALGIGLRVSRVFKVNAGMIPYRTNNDNPLSNNYTVNVNGYVSIGIDVNLLGALGKVSELLKL